MSPATIRLNGRTEPLAVATVAELVAGLGVGPEAKGVAVALNGAVVPRSTWAATALAAGDEVEVIRALQGG